MNKGYDIESCSEKGGTVGYDELLMQNLKILESVKLDEVDVDECMKTLASCAASLGARIEIEVVDGGKKRIALRGREESCEGGVPGDGKKGKNEGFKKKTKKESLEWLKLYLGNDTTLIRQYARDFGKCKRAIEVIYVVNHLSSRYKIDRKVIKSLKFFEGLSSFLTFEKGSSPGNLLRTYNNQHYVKWQDSLSKEQKRKKERDWD